LKKLVFSVIAVLAISSAAFADQTKTAATTKKSPAVVSPTKTAPSTSAAAQAVLSKLNAALTAATGLSYTSDIDYAVPGPTGAISKHTSTQVTVEKSGKISIHVKTDGVLQAVVNADGSNVTVYDADAAKYSTAASQPGLSGTGAALGQVLPLVFTSPPTDSGTALSVALRFAFGFLGNRAVVLTPPPDGTAVYTLSKVVVGGKTLASAAMEFKSVQYHSGVITYVVDPVDNSRLYVFSQAIVEPTGPPIVRYKETFSTFKVLSSPADSSVYGFTPPVTATFIASAPPAAPTSPEAPTPTPPVTSPTPTPAPGSTTATPQSAPTAPSAGTGGGGAPAPPNSPIPVAPGSPAPPKTMPGAPPL